MDKQETKNKQKKKKGFFFFVYFFLVVILAVIIYTVFFNNGESSNVAGSSTQDSIAKAQKEEKNRQDMLKAASSSEDTNVRIIRVSNPEDLNVPYTIDQQAGKTIKRVFTGRRINIAITGLDNRIGTRSNHADANHVLSILIDSGLIEITDIPRDTPADAGMPDTSNQNKLTIVRSNLGREEYLKTLADIAGLDKIQYYIEAGFSQVMGLIEFLGFKDSKSTLQVLRSRTGLGGDDYQRCYNQGQFIRQMILKNFNKVNGFFGDLLLRGGLALVETNLTLATLKDITSRLAKKGFPHRPDDITLRVRPPLGMNFKVYDFTKESTIENLRHKIENFNLSRGMDSIKVVQNVSGILWDAIHRCYSDTARKPNNVIKNLIIYFEQHAWLQVENLKDRDSIREHFCMLLKNAYRKKKQFDKASHVQEVVDEEKELFSKPFK